MLRRTALVMFETDALNCLPDVVRLDAETTPRTINADVAANTVANTMGRHADEHMLMPNKSAH